MWTEGRRKSEGEGRSYLKQIGHSEVHHEHHTPLGFPYVDPKHPQSKDVTQQAGCQDDAVHHSINVVLVLVQSNFPRAAALGSRAVIHLKDTRTSAGGWYQKSCLWFDERSIRAPMPSVVAKGVHAASRIPGNFSAALQTRGTTTSGELRVQRW